MFNSHLAEVRVFKWTDTEVRALGVCIGQQRTLVVKASMKVSRSAGASVLVVVHLFCKSTRENYGGAACLVPAARCSSRQHV